jgi:hypothetical protein
MLRKRLVDEISAGPAAACARDQRPARLQDRAIARIAPPHRPEKTKAITAGFCPEQVSISINRFSFHVTRRTQGSGAPGCIASINGYQTTQTDLQDWEPGIHRSYWEASSSAAKDTVPPQHRSLA